MTKRVIVFGSSGDIGSEITLELIKSGFEVTSSSSQDCNFLSAASVSDFLESVHFTPHHLVFASGINHPQPILDMSMSDFDDSMRVNFESIARITTYFAEAQAKIGGSSNVALSSLYAEGARVGRSGYSASKAALEALFRSLATELGPRGVRYNVIRPGFIGTRLTYSNNSESQISHMVSRIPMNRLGTPGEVASVVKFLLSDSSSYVNGSVVTVDGGYSGAS